MQPAALSAAWLILFSLGIMTDAARLVFSAIIAVAALCLLIVVFMIAADRTSEQRRFRSFTASFLSGVSLIVFAGVLSGIALDADRHHSVIPPTYKSGWMSPEQGYGAAILLLLAGIYALFSQFATRVETMHPETPNRTMEVVASGRYILLFGSSNPYPVAMSPIARDTSSWSR